MPGWPRRGHPSYLRLHFDFVKAVTSLLLDDVVLQRRDEGEDFSFFFLGHFELIERGGEMFRGGVPVCVGDAEARMCCLHVSSCVNTWSTSGRAKLIENVLANLLPGIIAVAHEEFLKLLVRNKP